MERTLHFSRTLKEVSAVLSKISKGQNMPNDTPVYNWEL